MGLQRGAPYAVEQVIIEGGWDGRYPAHYTLRDWAAVAVQTPWAWNLQMQCKHLPELWESVFSERQPKFEREILPVEMETIGEIIDDCFPCECPKGGCQHKNHLHAQTWLCYEKFHTHCAGYLAEEVPCRCVCHRFYSRGEPHCITQQTSAQPSRS